MKKALVIISAVLAIALALPLLASCGSSSDGTDSSDESGINFTPVEIKGDDSTWGNITVFVPEDSYVSEGSMINPENPDSLRILKTGNEAYYYMITVYDSEEQVKSSVSTTKEINEGSDPKDVSFEAGGLNWTGIAYTYAGVSDCFQVWAKSGERYILVGAGWHAYDSDEAVKILGSIKIAG